MKKQIDLLVKLANEYKEYCLSSAIKVRMSNHNVLSGRCSDFEWSDRDKKEISIYFNGTHTCSVTFHGVEISFYSGKVALNYGLNENDLFRIYEECSEYLDYIKSKIPLLKEQDKKKKKLDELEKAKKLVAILEKELS